MGSRTSELGVHPGKPTPGGKSRDPTHCDQNPASRNTISTGGTTHMEKPRPPDKYQCPIGPLTTRVGKPTTPKPGPDGPKKETPSSSHNAGDEAATGATQTPRVPKATSTLGRGRTRGSSPLNTCRIIRGTSLGSTVRTTPTAFPAPPLSFAA